MNGGDTKDPGDPDDDSSGPPELEGSSERPSPVERPWIHPAELPSRQALHRPIEPQPIGRWIQIPMSIAAVMLLILGIAMLVSRPHDAETEDGIHTAARLAAAPGVISRSAGSIEVLTIATGAGTRSVTGVALLNRQVITTTAQIPSDAIVYASDLENRPVAAIGVHRDVATGVTVLVFSVPVVEAAAVVARTPTSANLTAVSVEPSPGPDSVHWASTTVKSTDAVVESGSISVGALTTANPLSTEASSLLTDQQGRAEAISDPSLGAGAYLPVGFAFDLTKMMIDLPMGGHGHFGVTCRSTAIGVEVIAIASGSPADGIVFVDDLIISIGSRHVTKVSDLVNAVYLQPAGTSADVTIKRSGQTMVLSVTFTAGP